MTGKIPVRSEVPDTYKWKISDIFADKTAWTKAITDIKRTLPKLAAFQTELKTAKKILACLTLADKINIKLGAAFAYARLQQDTDTTSTDSQAMTASVLPLLDEAAQAAAFIEPELLNLPQAKLISLSDALPGLHKYHFFFQELLRQKAHVLPAEQESFLAATGELRQTASQVYTTFTNADLKFPDTLDEDGHKAPLAESRYMVYLRSHKRKVRKIAFKKLFRTYLSYRNTFAALYSSSIKSSHFLAKARHYDSMLEMALSTDNIPLAVYDTTLETTHRFLPLLHRYTALKKQLLAVHKLHGYDLYAPLVPALKRTFPYPAGLDLIQSALQPLGPKYLKDMSTGIHNGWIDLYENQGKRSGAYSWGVYGVHPFILTSYNQQYDAVSTLAHELGHSMHSFYSSQKQDFINSEYTIFCAEVASTTNENLLLEYMLAHAPQKDQAFFLNQYLEQIRTTVYRQVLFAEFEKDTHAAIEQGKPLTADTLEGLWLDLNRTYYGPELEIDDELRAEWSRIPHFYRPFYVYQYATGYAAALTLSKRLRTNKGRTARTAYLKYLSQGGSDYSIDLLRAAGVDMATAVPLTVTFHKFETCLDKLAALI
jgi:oligoendopeptidase F